MISISSSYWEMGKEMKALANREGFLAALTETRLSDIYALLEAELGKKPSASDIKAIFAQLQKDESIAQLFRDLRHFDLERVPKYQLAGILAMIDFFPNFESLMLWSDSSHKSSRIFAEHSTIKKLEFIRWRKLHDISSLASLKRLRALRFVEADSLLDVSPLAQISEFHSLALDVFRPELDLNALASSSIKKLDLRYYPHNSLRPLSKITGLEQLSMKLSNHLETIEAIGELNNLKDLQIEVSPKLNDFSAIRDLDKLEQLWLSLLNGFQKKAIDLSFIREMPALKTLIVERMPREIRELSFLEGLPNLKELNLRYLSEVQDISPIGTLKSLEVLNFQNNTIVSDFSVLQTLPALKNLRLFGCEIEERGLAESLKAMLPNCKIVY